MFLLVISPVSKSARCNKYIYDWSVMIPLSQSNKALTGYFAWPRWPLNIHMQSHRAVNFCPWSEYISSLLFQIIVYTTIHHWLVYSQCQPFLTLHTRHHAWPCNVCSSCSCLHSRKGWSVPKARGDSRVSAKPNTAKHKSPPACWMN